LRISFSAEGVIKSLPAIRSAVNDPFAISVRNDRTVSGPSGQKTAIASASVIRSSSCQFSGCGRVRARASGSRRGTVNVSREENCSQSQEAIGTASEPAENDRRASTQNLLAMIYAA
jgi:hypothetical protein